MMRQIMAAVRGLIALGEITRNGHRPQIRFLSRRVSPDVRMLRPQGVYFREPDGAVGMLLAPNGDPSEARGIAFGVDNVDLAAPLGQAEGGLHFDGEWLVFLTDGELHLGARTASDQVARASLVEAEFAALRADIDTLKTAVAAGLNGVGASPAASGSAGAAAFNEAATGFSSAEDVGSDVVFTE